MKASNHEAVLNQLRLRFLKFSVHIATGATLYYLLFYAITSQWVLFASCLPAGLWAGILQILVQKRSYQLATNFILPTTLLANSLCYFYIEETRPFVILLILAQIPATFCLIDYKKIKVFTFWLSLPLLVFICLWTHYGLSFWSHHQISSQNSDYGFGMAITVGLIFSLSTVWTTRIIHLTEKALSFQQIAHLSRSKHSVLGQMAAGIAHEVNNPLLIISGTAEQTLEILESSHLLSDEALEKNLQSIHRQSLRIGKIINGLQHLSRKGAPSFDRFVPLPELVDQALETVRYKAQKHQVLIDTDLTDALVLGSETELIQVFHNLLSNAIDALMDIDHGTILIKSFWREDELVITIEDNGEGIPEDHVKKIMDPFFTTKPLGKGTGLGLSLCHGILANHHSRLKLTSPRNPTRFEFSLKAKAIPQPLRA